MRIREISVHRLFGLFDHEVGLNLEDRVSIIHGPNGFGKTTLLQMVDSLFAGRYSDLRRIPFRDFRVTFENDDVLQVLRVATSNKPGPELTLTLKGKEFKLPALSPELLGIPTSFIEHSIPFLTRTSESHWRDRR